MWYAFFVDKEIFIIFVAILNFIIVFLNLYYYEKQNY